jgi:hypothetical protein
VVESRLDTHDTIRESGCFVVKKSCYVLRICVYETPVFVTEVLRGSALHFRTVIANCCNIGLSQMTE